MFVCVYTKRHTDSERVKIQKHVPKKNKYISQHYLHNNRNLLLT